MQQIVPFLWFDGKAEEAMNRHPTLAACLRARFRTGPDPPTDKTALSAPASAGADFFVWVESHSSAGIFSVDRREQGRRHPDEPAAAYLLAIKRRPREIMEAVAK